MATIKEMNQARCEDITNALARTLKKKFALGLLSINSGSFNKIAQTEWLKQGAFTSQFSECWKAQDHGISRSGSWPALFLVRRTGVKEQELSFRQKIKEIDREERAQ